ncbi:unnamed protein product [Amaranthus hypochondriacus]
MSFPWNQRVHLMNCMTETEVYFQDRDDCYRLSKEEDRKSMMAECAVKTLDYFNRINGTDYKFEKYVEFILSNYEHSHAIRCNFIAKPEIAPLKAGDFSAKLFFAELIPFGIYERWVTDCAMLDGGEDEIKKECLMCPPGVIAHPLSFQDGIKLPLENTEGFELVLASEDMDYL